MPDVGLLLSGSVQFGFLAADNTTIVGNFDSKNTVKFEYNPGTPDLKNRISKATANYGSILDQVAIPKVNAVNLSFDTIDADAFSVLLRGSKSGLTVTGATVAPATFTVSAMDVWVPIGQRFLSAVTVTNTGATTTYLLGTDYLLDTTDGYIKFLSTGAITAGPIKLGYANASYSGSLISAETKTQLYLSVLFKGRNFADGKYVEVSIPKYACAPAGAVDFMAEDFVVAALTGSAISVNGASPLTAVYVTPPTGF